MTRFRFTFAQHSRAFAVGVLEYMLYNIAAFSCASFCIVCLIEWNRVVQGENDTMAEELLNSFTRSLSQSAMAGATPASQP